jgi:hypothetical protein
MALVMAIVLASTLICFSDNLFREVFGSQANQSCGNLSPDSLAQWPHSAPSPVLRSNSTGNSSTRTSHCALAMPRLRGKSCRGAAWYAAVSQRKRKAQIEAAMVIVARWRKNRPRMPPMVYVEEVVPEGGLPSPPENLFMVPENWNPSMSFDSHNTQQPTSNVLDPVTDSTMAPYSPCFIKEEAPPEHTTDAEDPGCARHENRTSEAEAIASKDFMGSHHSEQPPAADWGYLNLVFEIRDKLDDQIFRLGRMDQRLDMFFAAHSRAASKKQCPTCARPYSFPARWRHTEI